MEKSSANSFQSNKFDRIFKENMKVTLPFILKNTLDLDIREGHDLPGDVQYTKERKPDMLRRIQTAKGKELLLHVEYQTTNDKSMVCRMAEYNVMLRRAYNILPQQSIKQYVLFFGKNKARMLNEINAEELQYRYHLIQISEIDYELFLNSENPEDQILAILGDLKGNDPKQVLSEILNKLHGIVRGELANSKYVNQLRILSQLRKLEDDFKYITTMGHISSFFKIEKDPFYKEGVQIGHHEQKLITAKELKAEGCDDNFIVKITKLSLAEVKKLK